MKRQLCNTHGVQGVVEFEVATVEPLYRLCFAVILANAADCDTETIIEARVCDGDIGTVCFQGNAIIAVIHSPVVHLDVGRADGVGTVGIG